MKIKIIVSLVCLMFVIVSVLAQDAEEPRKPRVLLLGDSISLGYTASVSNRLQNKAEVIHPPTNCKHTGCGLQNLKTWLGTGRWDVIHFNFGIWDTQLLNEKGAWIPSAEESKTIASNAAALHIRYTPEQYRENLVKLTAMLQETGAKLIWASTTPVMSRTGARFEDIKIRNVVAVEVMRANHIEINDLYDYVLPHIKEWQRSDQVHFNAVGYEKLGERVSEVILRALENKPRQ